MKKLLFLFIIFICQFSFAADDGDFWLQREIETYDGNSKYAERKSKVYGKSARMFREEVPIPDTTRTQVRDLIKRSIAVDTPTPAKVGTPMLKRVNAVAKGNVASVLGTYAVMELIEAIGWVMKDGTYVKQIPKNQPFECSVDNLNFGDCNTILSQEYKTTATLSSSQITQYTKLITDAPTRSHTFGSTPISCSPAKVGSCTSDRVIYATFYLRKANSTEYTDVPLTAPTLGTIMLGSGYVDPAGDTSAENTVNDGDYTGVKETYEYDSSGIGNEAAEDMDQKLRNAPDTPDGSASYVGDPKYDSADLPADSDTADRSWNEDAGEATGGTEQEVDSEGNPTGNTSISLKFPLACSWFSDVCQWYDDWKKSDQVYKDHMTKTEEHQKDEKSFWEWFQKDDVSNNEQDSDVEDDNQLPELSTNTFNFGGMCPSDINLPIPDPFGHTNNLTLSFQTFCFWLTKLNPWIDVLGWIIAITILTGQRSANNEQ